MRQLVAGLAALHPAWRIDGGEGWEDRDRHHQTVRRRLGDLQAMGLLRWRAGTDLEGEERRTELELRAAPEVSDEELRAAAARLKRWQARYGPALNTGSRTGIRNAAGHGRPLGASERQRRGCAQARRAAAARRRTVDGGSKSNSSPPSGAPATLENDTLTSTALEMRKGERTGVTRTHESEVRNASAALNAFSETTGNDEIVGGGEGEWVAGGAVEGAVGAPAAAGGVVFDAEALVARVREREAQRRPVLEAIAGRVAERALEVAGWGSERSWPFSRLREAWVVARWGSLAAADSGPSAAGPLYPDDHARLRRAVARYERNHEARPDGYPAGGLGALLHLGALAGAGELAGGPRTLRYAVGALDQLSRRMRALATADSPDRAESAARRAQQRREPAPRALGLAFRAAWPPWLVLDEHGQPTFDRLGMLRLNPEAKVIPPAGSDAYRMVVRDAYLLAGRRLPVDVDGRTQMALRHQRQIPPADRRPVYSDEERELLELAHRTGQPLRTLTRLSDGFRRGWLAQLRAREAERARREAAEFKARLARISEQHRPAAGGQDGS